MYKRILLKLSGEALFSHPKEQATNEVYKRIALSIKELNEQGIQVAIVVGGGNIFRGTQAAALGMDRVSADSVGMIATLINGLLLQQAFSLLSCEAKVLSAFECNGFVEKFEHNRAIKYLEQGAIVIFTGGTGLPYFSTDTAAALRAVEIKAEIFLKATKVNGVYDKDPAKYKDAVRFPSISYEQIISSNLGVMDLSAAALCMEHRLPILVFDILEQDSLKRAVFQRDIGTLVTGDRE